MVNIMMTTMLWFSLYVSGLSGSIDGSYNLDACWLSRDGRPVVRFDLVNKKQILLEIPYRKVPWNDHLIMFLYRGGLSAGFELKQKYFLRDFSPDLVAVGPRGTISEEISLDEHFLDVGSAEDVRRLIFMWSYSTAATGAQRHDFNGVIYFYDEQYKCSEK